MPPTPVAELYIPCTGLACTIGGVAFAIISGGFVPGFDEDDMTNNLYYGFHSDIPTKRTATFSLEVASLAGGGPSGLLSGLKYVVLINCATLPTIGVDGQRAAPTPVVNGAPSFAGEVRIKPESNDILDVSKGVKVKFSGKSQEQYSYTL